MYVHGLSLEKREFYNLVTKNLHNFGDYAYQFVAKW